MSEHVGKPGTATGWAIHQLQATPECVDCGWWAHTATPPKTPSRLARGIQDNAGAALIALFPEDAALQWRNVLRDYPRPAGGPELATWKKRNPRRVARRMASRHDTTHAALMAILEQLWEDRQIAA